MFFFFFFGHKKIKRQYFLEIVTLSPVFMVCLLFAKHCDWMLSALFTLPYLALIATFQDKYYNQSYLKLKKKIAVQRSQVIFPRTISY